MDFELTDEQRLLADSVERMLADRYTFEDRRRHLAHPQGFDPAIWQAYADLGLLALPFAEEDGGLGGGAEEIMIVMEALGRVLAVEPYLQTAVVAGSLLRHAASAEQRAGLVPGIAEGRTRLAVAHAETAARYRVAHVATTARETADGWQLDGAKTLVADGEHADLLIVSARTAGAVRDEAGVVLLLVDPKSDGVEIRGYQTQDGGRAAEIALSGVKLGRECLLTAAGHDAMPSIRRAVDEGLAAVCAEAVGAMQRTLDLTVDYLKTRKQFGRPIGEFQVLQHRAADMLVALEQARSMAMFATAMCRDSDADARGRAMSAAKVQIGQSGRFIGQSAVQLHGGIGMTMEYAVGHYFKRLTMIDKAFGDADHHLERLSAAGGLTVG